MISTTPSTSPVSGELYFDSNTLQIKVYHGGRWENIDFDRDDLLNEFFTDIEWEVLC